MLVLKERVGLGVMEGDGFHAPSAVDLMDMHVAAAVPAKHVDRSFFLSPCPWIDPDKQTSGCDLSGDGTSVVLRNGVGQQTADATTDGTRQEQR